MAQRMQAPTGRQHGRGRAVRPGEAVGLGLECATQAPGQGRRQAQAQLRTALVGRDDQVLDGIALQHLPMLQPGIGGEQAGPGVDLALDMAVLGQQARAGRGHQVRKVLPVVVVRHPLGLHAVAQPGADAAVGVDLPGVARAAGAAVVRQQVQLQAAGMARLQIAELAGHRHATAGHHDRRDGRVAVGRDVPVIGHAGLEATAAVEPDAGRQPAALAVVRQRKAQHRQREDGHAQKLQHRAFGDALVGVEVELDAVGAQQPVGHQVLVARAAGVGGLLGAQPRAVREVDPRGAPARAQALELEHRLQKETLESLHVQLQLGAAVAHAVAADQHLATGDGQVIDAVVGQALGADHRAGAAELDVALGHRVGVGAHAQRVGAQDHRPLVRGIAARRWRQPGAGLQWQRLVGPRRPGQHGGSGQRHGGMAPPRRRQDGPAPGVSVHGSRGDGHEGRGGSGEGHASGSGAPQGPPGQRFVESRDYP